MKISKKLIISFLGCGLVPMGLVGMISYMNARGGMDTISGQGGAALETAAYDQLVSLREIKQQQVSRYFDERKGDLDVLTNNVKAIHHDAWEGLAGIQENKRALVETLFADMRTQIETLAKSHAVRNAFADFKAYHDESGAAPDSPLDVTTDEYRAIYDKWYDEFAVYVDNYGYYDIFFLCSAHGHVLFTEAKEPDLGANVGAGPLRNEGLGKLWRAIVDSGQTSIVDFEPYTPSNGDYAAFMGTPVFDEDGKMISVIALQLPTGPVNAIVQTRAGLGESGETYLVGRHDGKTSFRSDLLTMGDGAYVIGAEIRTDYIDRALNGESGQKVFFDSSGKPVLVCYEPLDIPGVNWAQITKMNMEECFTLTLEGEHEDFFTKYANAYGYYDLFLFHPDGYCFYSVAREADYRTNLVNGPYADSSLGRAVKECLNTRRFAFGDFAPYAPSDGAPAAFIAEPAVSDGEVEVVVALQLSDKSISDIMAAGSSKEKALEAYLVGSDGHMRSNSILSPQEHSIAASFAKGNRVDTEATRGALSGATDAAIITDYLGSSVLSAWAPLKVYDADWALITEIDEAVAMEAVATMHETSSRSVASLVAWVGGLAVIATVLTTILAIVLAQAISRPIAKVVDRIKDIAQGEGDLTKRVDQDRRDEMGELGKWFNTFVEKIENIICDIAGGAAQIDGGSEQVSASSQSLSEGASEQAASLQQISSSLEEIAAMTNQNAEHVQQASSLGDESKSAAERGRDEMTSMTAAMSEIKASSDEISKIMKVIDEIAFQTNLLALNAAVEAARAGEAGKGFAVVAEEVRTLAQRSAEAAKDTSQMIEQATMRADNGVAIADRVGTSLEEIAASTTKVTTLLNEIASASKEQAQGINQVNDGVTQLDTVTQQNAGNSEELASAAEETSAQATAMRELVGSFKYRDTSGSASERVAVARSAGKSLKTQAPTSEQQIPFNGGEDIESF
jgi:methyl-accepting chemotaxis protein